MTGDAPLPPSLVAANLRRLAKERLYMGSPPTDLAPLSPEEVLHLMHELQVKQIELQIQNEALQTSQAKEKSAALRYTELYDFAPVGYVTLNRTGAFIQSNLVTTRLLCRLHFLRLTLFWGLILNRPNHLNYLNAISLRSSSHSSRSSNQKINIRIINLCKIQNMFSRSNLKINRT